MSGILRRPSQVRHVENRQPLRIRIRTVVGAHDIFRMRRRCCLGIAVSATYAYDLATTDCVACVADAWILRITRYAYPVKCR